MSFDSFNEWWSYNGVRCPNIDQSRELCGSAWGHAKKEVEKLKSERDDYLETLKYYASPTNYNKMCADTVYDYGGLFARESIQRGKDIREGK